MEDDSFRYMWGGEGEHFVKIEFGGCGEFVNDSFSFLNGLLFVVLIVLIVLIVLPDSHPTHHRQARITVEVESEVFNTPILDLPWDHI